MVLKVIDMNIEIMKGWQNENENLLREEGNFEALLELFLS